MSRKVSLWLATVSVGVFLSSIGASAAAQDAKAASQSFLEQAAEAQQIAISLGQLATQRASNKQVKELGAEMVEDQKKAGHQIEQLALQEGVQLFPGLSQEHRLKVNELSQLSGHAFDRAYVSYTLWDHEATVEQFEQRVMTVQDKAIKQWVTSTLPILQAHLKKTRLVKSTLQTNP